MIWRQSLEQELLPACQALYLSSGFPAAGYREEQHRQVLFEQALRAVVAPVKPAPTTVILLR